MMMMNDPSDLPMQLLNHAVIVKTFIVLSSIGDRGWVKGFTKKVFKFCDLQHCRVKLDA
uniref:Uncharacterized protein n=1 Tax=Arion vulgaris TaxID=1028688 RepID=A0A0B7BEK5_9EUPU